MTLLSIWYEKWAAGTALIQQQEFIQQSTRRIKGRKEKAARGKTEGEGREGMKEGKMTGEEWEMQSHALNAGHCWKGS